LFFYGVKLFFYGILYVVLKFVMSSYNLKAMFLFDIN